MSENSSKDLRNLSKDELALKLSGLKADLYKLRYQSESGRIEKPHRIKQIKRAIARINTIFKEGELKNGARAK